ncbi:MAG: hypothetical protein FJ014_07340 [Chloroflexi bacterium]|nr:hypothetical protein [Chloroflexota bacterium]
MRPLVVAGIALCLLGWVIMACQSPPPTPTSSPLPTTAPPPTPTQPPTPGPLTDAEAIALIKQEIAARGIASHTLRISIGQESRSASIRYSSSYDVDSSVFNAQTVLIALTAARAIARVQPPVNGGIRLAVMPAGEGEVGLRVTAIGWPSLEAWGNGDISDQEFVSQWTVGDVTRE